MNHPADSLRKRFYAGSIHPYQLFEQAVEAELTPSAVLLDAGCGRTMPVLRKFIGKAGRLVGVEVVEFTDVADGAEAITADLGNVPLPSGSVDLIMSRSVFEHLVDPERVYAEAYRLLKPGGKLIFLTASLWDYATTIARLVPNRLHGRIVAAVEGRAEEDVFPTAYKTNCKKDVTTLAEGAGLHVGRIQYLGQYPNYFMFSRVLFLLGTAYDKIVSRYEFLAPLRGWMLVTLTKPSASRASAT